MKRQALQIFNFRWVFVSLLTTLWLGAMGQSVAADGLGNANAVVPLELSPEDFVQRLRRPMMRDTFAALEGEVSHVRRNSGRAEHYPIYFGVIFQRDRMLGQLVLDHQEGYFLGQAYGSGTDGGTFRAMPKPMTAEGQAAPVVPEERLVERLGIQPGDLTLGFLYWDFQRELPGKSVKTVSCRVLVFRNPATGELVKSYVSREYYFALKAEFYPADGNLDEKPQRTLEITGFKEVDEYYVVTSLAILGKEYRTRIDFSEIRVGANNPEQPENVFRILPGSEVKPAAVQAEVAGEGNKEDVRYDED